MKDRPARGWVARACFELRYAFSKRSMRFLARVACCTLLLAAMDDAAPVAANPGPDSWITLGTGGGPLVRIKRAQSANALIVGDQVVLFDAGEGVIERLAAAGVGLEKVDAVVLSHLHPDHTSGLPALIALRWQNGAVRPLTVYGPIGTAEFVQGIMASLKPVERTGFATSEPLPDPATWVKVLELPCAGETTRIGTIDVKAVQNTHYVRPDGSNPPDAASCSFRVETGSRTIVYTGDTGPSAAVAELATDADLLVSEVIDLNATFAALEKHGTSLSPAMKEGMKFHLTHHHLTPDDVGKLAAAANVKRVVLTHISPGLDDETSYGGYVDGVHKAFAGPVQIAADGDRF